MDSLCQRPLQVCNAILEIQGAKRGSIPNRTRADFVDGMTFRAMQANKSQTSSFRWRFSAGAASIVHNKIAPSVIASHGVWAGHFRAIRSVVPVLLELAATRAARHIAWRPLRGRPALWRTVVDDHSALALRRSLRPCARSIRACLFFRFGLVGPTQGLLGILSQPLVRLCDGTHTSARPAFAPNAVPAEFAPCRFGRVADPRND